MRMSTYRNIISEFALRHRLPTMFGQSDYALAGGLLSYAPSFPALTHRAASYVDKILKGANPADLPIQQPTHIELIVNLKTARALGISIPQSILIRADEVIR
jgi:putative ABC transport system substrate-binding protein